MKAVLASHNPGKLKEMQLWLAPLGIQLVLESDLGLDIEVDETGATFEENSLLKARTVADKTHMLAIADDSGLCVDALNGAPGVHTARYGGDGLDDSQRYHLLLSNLGNSTDRKAKFVSVVTCVFPNGDIVSARGELPGTITAAPKGSGGFGYDPVFFVPTHGKTLAEMTMDERADCSHRAAAIRALSQKLADYQKEQSKDGNRWS